MHVFRLRSVLALVALGFTLSLAACGDDDEETPDDGVAALTVMAELDADASVGQNTLEITVTDASGAAVADAVVVVDPQMPMMGHGSSEDPVVTNNGDGSYTAFPVTFTMAGEWEVTITAQTDDAFGELVETFTL